LGLVSQGGGKHSEIAGRVSSDRRVIRGKGEASSREGWHYCVGFVRAIDVLLMGETEMFALLRKKKKTERKAKQEKLFFLSGKCRTVF